MSFYFITINIPNIPNFLILLKEVSIIRSVSSNNNYWIKIMCWVCKRLVHLNYIKNQSYYGKIDIKNYILLQFWQYGY